MKLLAVGPNSHPQKTMEFDRLEPGEVNRAASVMFSISGKGINFAAVTHRLAPGCCTIAHCSGGCNGHAVRDALDALGIPQIVQTIAASSRTCTTLLCRATGSMTELIDPSPNVEPAEAEAFTGMVFDALPGMDAIALCGTMQPGLKGSLYADIASAKGADSVLVLDGYRDVEAVLATGNVDILKINRLEVSRLMDEGDWERAVAKVFATYTLKWLGVTDGPGSALLSNGSEKWTYVLPEIDDVLNPIGAGDTVTGVMTVKHLEGADMPDAFAWGLAAGSDSCRHLEPGKFALDGMQALREQIVVRPA